MNSAELFVKCLEAEGVQYVFGLPGEENLDFVEALRTSRIKFIVTRDEQSAVFMATTIGRLTGKVGVALATLGPGATNMLTGVAYAELLGAPILLITGQKPIKGSKQGKFQIVNVVDMMKPVTKFSKTIVSGNLIQSLVRHCVKLAEAERPGAVHLEFPEDVAREEIKEGLSTEPIIPQKVRRPNPDVKALDQAMQIIQDAKNPIIVVASGANRKLVGKQLKVFIEKTKIPFVTTQMGKGVVDEEMDEYMGTTALSAGDFVHQALNSADVVLMLGHDISEKPPVLLREPKHKVIHLNFYPAEIDDVYVPTLEVVGDISHALWYMSEHLVPSQNWSFEDSYKVRDALNKNINEFIDSKDFPIRIDKAVNDIKKVIPEDTILALDNGMYKIWLARNFKARSPNTILLDNAFATMGAGLPSGIATKLIYPEKPVLVIAGDGGIMMNIAELETAIRLGVNLLVLILNDSGFGMIRWKQKDMHLPEFGMKFGNPDFVKLAESFGAKGYRIDKAEDLASTLQKAFKEKGVHIIDCPVDYEKANEMLASIKNITI